MNVRRHRLVFSPRLGMLVPREETGAARVKAAGGQSRRPGGPVRRCLVRAALVLLPTIAGMTQVHANPTAATVVSGSASFNTSGATLTVTNSPNAIINWGSFSIGQNELTRFVQQSSASSVLNRVIGQDPSQILGQLQSNGRVYLVNPNGILFGQGARIDVAGLIASSLDISDTDYLAGRFKFVGNGSEGLVSNAGEITTPTGGQVLLIAPNVENSGVISSPSGEILLAAGHTVDLVDSANPALRVEITASDGRAINLGTLIAEGGRLGVYAGLITQAGTVSASSAVAEGGRIYLKGTQAVTLADTGVIEANGTRGGEIIAKVEANGQLSGRIDVQGTLTARGDGSPDSGGFIETSAAEVKIGTVRVNTGGGEWLIDPVDFTIAASGGDMTGDELGELLGQNSVTIFTTPDSGTNPEFERYGMRDGNGDIFVNDEVSWDSTSTLNLSAAGSIAINANITAGRGGLSLLASDGNIGIAAGATVRIDALYAQAGGSFSNLGDLRIGSGSAGGDRGNLISAASVNNAGTLYVDGLLSNIADSVFVVTNELVPSTGNSDNILTNRFNVSLQADSPIQNSGVIVNNGQLLLESGALELAGGGVYRGNGTLIGDLVNTAGTVAPGASPGTVTITGNYTQGPSGTLLVEIGGVTPGQQYDVLHVGGTATLDGTLAIQHYGGYLPAAGASFPGVVTAGAVSGAFSTLTAPAGFDYGFVYNFSNTASSVDLTLISASLAGMPPTVQQTVVLLDASLVLAAPSFQTPQLSASGQTTDTAASGHQFSSSNLWPGQLPGGAPGADAGPGGQGTGFAQSLAAALAQGTSLAAALAQAQAQAQAQTPAAALAQGGNSAEAVARASEPRASLDPAPHPAPSSTGLDTLASALAQGQSPQSALERLFNQLQDTARRQEWTHDTSLVCR